MQKAAYNSLSNDDRATASDLADLIMENLTQATIGEIIDNPNFKEESDDDEPYMREYKEARLEAFLDLYGFEFNADVADDYDTIVDAADELVLEKLTS